MEVEDLPRTVDEAKRLGFHYIWTGVPCEHGHVDVWRLPVYGEAECIVCKADAWLAYQRVLATTPPPNASKYRDAAVAMARAGVMKSGVRWPYLCTVKGPHHERKLHLQMAKALGISNIDARRCIDEYVATGALVVTTWLPPRGKEQEVYEAPARQR